MTTKKNKSAASLDAALRFLQTDENRYAFAEYIQESFPAVGTFIRHKMGEDLLPILAIDERDKRLQAATKALDVLTSHLIVLVVCYLHQENLLALQDRGFATKAAKVVGVEDGTKLYPGGRRRPNRPHPKVVQKRKR